MAYLEVKELYKSYSKSEILKGISFDLEEGEVLTIIGSSGSGKTTALRCLNFLEIADKGDIKINGNVIFSGGNKKIKDNELRSNRLHLGLVFQSFNLFPQYNAFENIKLPLMLRENEKKKKKENYKTEAEIENIVYDLLNKVGLKDKALSYPCELSGGQQQRIAIARAVALDPDILCFDEPTSALDPLLTVEVLNVINDIKKTLKKTMIIVTHEMEFARRISDKVIFMDEGKIIEKGTAKEVFESPKSELLKQFLASYNNVV